MIETVQIRATNLIDGLGGLDYTERLKKLNIPTQAYRRARGDMTDLRKHFHPYDNATLSLSFQPRNRIRREIAKGWNMRVASEFILFLWFLF